MKNILIISTITILLLSSCVLNINDSRIKGSGTVTKEQRRVSSFSGIEVIGGSYTLHLTQCIYESVEVEIDDNLQQYIEVKNIGNELVLSNKDNVGIKPTQCNIYITLQHIDLLSVLGVCNVKSFSALNSDELAVNVSGVVNGELKVDCNELNVIINGVGNLELCGVTDKLNVTMSGVGNLNSMNLNAANVTAKNTGVGNINVYATEGLSLTNTGVGAISYAGDAKVEILNSSGIGKIKKVVKDESSTGHK